MAKRSKTLSERCRDSGVLVVEMITSERADQLLAGAGASAFLALRGPSEAVVAKLMDGLATVPGAKGTA